MLKSVARLLILSIVAASSFGQLAVAAQERIGRVQVMVSPDHADWTYEVGQAVRFRITALQDSHPLKGAMVSYKIGAEMMPPTIEKTAVPVGEGITIEAGTMQEPGFLRCIATVEMNGRSYRGIATAGFAPEKIQPTTNDPTDFDAFWKAGKDELAKLPINAKLTLLPDSSTPSVNTYHVSLQNIGGSQVYGILCEPKTEGKYPALLRVPGAGVRSYDGMVEMAEKGIITFEIGIHGLPVILAEQVYDSLRLGALAGYPTFNLDNRNRYYYRRVYLGCVRANDFLTSLPRWNGKDLVVTGGSQGGALSIVTAALDARVKGLAAYYPALADLTGYLKGRAGGWPHVFRATGADSHRSPEKIETSKYYDVVNFARRLRVPGIYTWGYNDETCPPTSMYAAYNVISAQKKLLLQLEIGHSGTPEMSERIDRWLEAFLKTGQVN
ncbi:MAG: acetylxylan esterase [Acidobacteria bacterium]|nr:acetylxylan esterase [Acidobacteriota bacterium]